MAKPTAPDASLERLGGGRWQTRDERFTIEPQSGTWVVVDAEATDELGLPLVRGPFPSLTAAARPSPSCVTRRRPRSLVRSSTVAMPIWASAGDTSGSAGPPAAPGGPQTIEPTTA